MTKNIKDYVVCVIYGGVSPESKVSLESGKSVLQALQKSGINAFGFEVNFDNIAELFTLKFDLAFIALHGSFGEDGRIQSILDWMQKPYTGSGVLASAIAMDKGRTKQVWSAMGLNTPRYTIVTRPEKDNFSIDGFNFPLAVKPMNLGSSFGITKVKLSKDLRPALDEAFKYDEKVLIEEWIEGEEYTLSIVEGFTLPSIKVTTTSDFYDYNAKYLSDGTKFIIPSGLSDTEEKSMQKEALRAFKALDCKGWGRVDLIRTKDGVDYLLEVNTAPGMTSHSLLPSAAAKAGISFEELVVILCKNALNID